MTDDRGHRLGHAQADLTGRSRIAWNVLVSWAGHAVFIASGFVMPRLIDRHVGQEALGIWDFAWSLVGYFGLAQLGVGASAGRYVAKYRAGGDVGRLGSLVSSVLALQLALSALVIALTATAIGLLPVLFGDRLGAHAEVVPSVLALLGASLALQMAFRVFHAVIVGCHRWDIHNAINAGFHAATVVGMIAAISMGGGLASLALVTLCGTVVTELTRCALAYRVCPEITISLRLVRWREMRRMLQFGAKSSVFHLASQLLLQGNRLIVVTFLGPAALALYSRPAALVRHVSTLVAKFAYILMPTASSLQAQKQDTALKALLLEGVRVGAGLTLPMVLSLAILGDPLLRLWMGPRYEQGALLALLALGSFPSIAQMPAVAILMGLNAHGRLALANLVVSILGLGFSLCAVALWQWDLLGAALGVTAAATLGTGILVPFWVCRHLQVAARDYLLQGLLLPTASVLPFALCLAAVRWSFDEPSLAVLCGGLAVAVLASAPVYWRYVLSDALRHQLSILTRDGLNRLRSLGPS